MPTIEQPTLAVADRETILAVREQTSKEQGYPIRHLRTMAGDLLPPDVVICTKHAADPDPVEYDQTTGAVTSWSYYLPKAPLDVKIASKVTAATLAQVVALKEAKPAPKPVIDEKPIDPGGLGGDVVRGKL